MWPGVWLNMENRTHFFISTSFKYPVKLLSITCRKQEKKNVIYVSKAEKQMIIKSELTYQSIKNWKENPQGVECNWYQTNHSTQPQEGSRSGRPETPEGGSENRTGWKPVSVSSSSPSLSAQIRASLSVEHEFKHTKDWASFCKVKACMLNDKSLAPLPFLTSRL